MNDFKTGNRVYVEFLSESGTEFSRTYFKGKGVIDLQPLKRSEAKYIKSAQDEFLTLFNFIYGENNV